MDAITDIQAPQPDAYTPSGRPSDFPPMAPGIYANIAEDRYHAGPEVSVSALKNFSRAPLAAVASEPEETKALHMGDVFHTLLLMPSLFTSKFYVTKLTRISDREKATQDEKLKAGDRELVKEADYEVALRMAKAVRSQSALINDLLAEEEIITEQSFYWRDPETGLPCRGRADVLHPGYRTIIDIKTTEDATAEGFARSVANYAYNWQQAFYARGLPLAGGWEPQGFLFLVIEKKPPFLTGLYKLEPRAVALGEDMTQHYLRQWARCAEMGRFPGLPTEAPVPLDLPTWAYAKAAA